MFFIKLLVCFMPFRLCFLYSSLSHFPEKTKKGKTNRNTEHTDLLALTNLFRPCSYSLVLVMFAVIL